MIRLEHVCIVHQLRPDGSRGRRTAIDKRPVDGPVAVAPLGLAGDTVCDAKHHGGRFRAVYVVSDEDAAVIEELLTSPSGTRLGRMPPVGWMGENFRVSGVSLSDVLLGERWRVGDCELAFTEPRIPCQTFARWVEQLGLDGARGWVKRFTRLGRPGGMCEVLVPGVVRAGEEVTVLHRPAHGLTLGEAFGPMPADKAAALLAAYTPTDVQPEIWRRAQAAVAR